MMAVVSEPGRGGAISGFAAARVRRAYLHRGCSRLRLRLVEWSRLCHWGLSVDISGLVRSAAKRTARRSLFAFISFDLWWHESQDKPAQSRKREYSTHSMSLRS